VVETELSSAWWLDFSKACLNPKKTTVISFFIEKRNFLFQSRWPQLYNITNITKHIDIAIRVDELDINSLLVF
jgi:hypothetical protein